MTERRPGVVSVVLVNFRGADDTIACISELKKVDWPKERLEIIVVENGSGDDSAARIREAHRDIMLVKSKKNLGFTGGSNLGVAKSSGEFVAFLNNDARPDAAWVRAAVQTFHQGRDIAAVASKVLDWEGRKIDFVDSAVSWFGMGHKPHYLEPDDGSHDEARDILFGTGAALFVRAEVFEQVGGFDERLFMFYDDVDLGWRLNLLGWRVRYQPASLAYHKHHASMKDYGDFREMYLLERNALYTIYKNLDEESLNRALPAAMSLIIRRSLARGGVDSGVLDLRVPGDDSDPDMSIPKTSAAGAFAIDAFVDDLPSLTETRRELQAGRRRTDRELSRLFGVTDTPLADMPRYLDGYDAVVDAFAVMAGRPSSLEASTDDPSATASNRRRILIVTGDSFGKKMAGPAIRVWNMALLLSKEHDVRVVSLTTAETMEAPFDIEVVSPHFPAAMARHEDWADVIVVQGYALQQFEVLESTQKVLVVDIYDPMHLEQLEQGREKDLDEWDDQILGAADSLNKQIGLGDFFLCASERQRLFWLGQMAAMGRINAHNYSRDESLNSLLAIAPFGLPDSEPVHTRRALRGVVPGIGEDDKIVVWAGGLYNWFDPKTLVRAVADLATRRDDVRLFFMGTKHPNPDVPEMAIVAETRDLARQLGVLDKNVFLNDSWVDYEDRQNYLLEADAGVSTHFTHVETTFSFRTRILDYLWTGLPIVSTRGDSFGDLVESSGLGVAVPELDVDALSAALESMLYDDEARASAKREIAAVRKQFVWENALAPLLEFCRQPVRAADKTPRSSAPTPGAPGPGRRSARSLITVRPPRRHGLAHDAERALFYLRHGGVNAVYTRVRRRLIKPR
ncbi:glycosyltransferase [Frigoribacterium faeni]|uniref:glycosyltransferase n=1 Tax=Frigoribacterium faeni TaxID=145483 RepID=UPI001FAC3FF9|nr:glycosyltransferase [Frigoribacterium faeni]MCJ0699745.1 glycosyltransferase [Frigoribacterium faeni]